MLRTVLKSKIHRATVTETELNYEGSLTLDRDLMDAADLYPFEHVQILNFHSGARFDTYVIEGPRGSGQVCLNGPAARLGQVSDPIIIISYVQLTEEEARRFTPTIVMVDDQNHPVSAQVSALHRDK